MLTVDKPVFSDQATELLTPEKTSGETLIDSDSKPAQTPKYLQIEWLGQTVASLCWITSVFFYGISEVGDWLQLFAASAWFVANVASLLTAETD